MKIETKYYLKPSTLLALQQFPPSTHIQQYCLLRSVARDHLITGLNGIWNIFELLETNFCF